MKDVSIPRFTVREMVLSGIFAAITVVFSQISIPVTPVPFSLGLFAVLLCAVVLETKLAVAAQLVYLLLGAAGAPVFAGFQGGVQRLIGPTGGYLISYAFIALTAGLILHKGNAGFLRMLVAAVAGVGVCYVCGASWLGFSMKLGFKQAVVSGILPFAAFDLIKAVAAALIGVRLRVILRKAGLQS